MDHGQIQGNDQEQPLELILARNLVSIVSLAAILIDVEGRIVFYNDAAGGIVGSPQGAPVASDELPRRCDVRRLLLVHHDPWHDDTCLEALGREASDRWAQLGGEDPVELGREGDVLDLAAP